MNKYTYERQDKMRHSPQDLNIWEKKTNLRLETRWAIQVLISRDTDIDLGNF